MLIVVNKIITKYKTDKQGNLILDPIKSKPIPSGIKTEREAIRIDGIKSIRPWHKSKSEEDFVKGDICAVYMFSLNKNIKNSEIHINENFEEFNKRAGSILLIETNE